MGESLGEGHADSFWRAAQARRRAEADSWIGSYKMNVVFI
jgi:hypothetical protein